MNCAWPTRSGVAPGELHAQRAVAIGAFRLVQHGAQDFFLGQRAFHHGHATAAASVGVEFDRISRFERLVDRIERRCFLVLCTHRYDFAGAKKVIEMLIADDGWRAVFVHDLLDHSAFDGCSSGANVRFRAMK